MIDAFTPDDDIPFARSAGLAVSPSMYGRIKSWLLQDQPQTPELFQGIRVIRKVRDTPSFAYAYLLIS